MSNKAFINLYSDWVDAFIPYLYANNGTLDLNPLQEALHYPPITSRFFGTTQHAQGLVAYFS